MSLNLGAIYQLVDPHQVGEGNVKPAEPHELAGMCHHGANGSDVLRRRGEQDDLDGCGRLGLRLKVEPRRRGRRRGRRRTCDRPAARGTRCGSRAEDAVTERQHQRPQRTGKLCGDGRGPEGE